MSYLSENCQVFTVVSYRILSRRGVTVQETAVNAQPIATNWRRAIIPATELRLWNDYYLPEKCSYKTH